MNETARALLETIPQEKAVDAVSTILFSPDVTSMQIKLAELGIDFTAEQCAMIADALEDEDEE